MSSKEKIRVGVAVIVRANEPNNGILLGRRGKDPNRGKYVIPCGGIEWGEGWREAAVREVQEETGLTVEIYGEPIRIMEIIGEGEHRVILVVDGFIYSGELKSGSDLEDVGFFYPSELPIDDISPAIVPTLKSIGWLR